MCDLTLGVEGLKEGNRAGIQHCPLFWGVMREVCQI